MDGLWVFLPVLGAFLVHGPVLRFDLVPQLKRPLDGGTKFRGRRLFGDNKTWRGVLAMFAGVLVATVALAQWPDYWRHLPSAIQRTSPWITGALIGLGVVLAELPNSFLKRQLGIAPGAQERSALGIAFAIFDQGDFVLGVWLLLAPIWFMSPAQAAVAFVVVALIHFAINLVGYAVGARTSWL